LDLSAAMPTTRPRTQPKLDLGRRTLRQLTPRHLSHVGGALRPGSGIYCKTKLNGGEL
jgi:hypothetical protein